MTSGRYALILTSHTATRVPCSDSGNAAESKSIVSQFATAGVPLFTAYYRRGQPRFVAARELVATGAIGTLVDVTYRKVSSHHVDERGSFALAYSSLPWRLEREHSGGGLLLDVGCHALDAIDFIAGPVGLA